MNVDIRDLRFFLAVAEANSFSKAAKKVHRTQPALTKCIQRLEDATGAPLFERSGRGIKLTTVGEALQERVKYLANTLDDTLRDISDLAKGISGQVSIGAIPVVVEYLLPGVCREIMAPDRPLSMRIFPETTTTLFKMLRENKLDIIIVPQVPLDEDLKYLTIMEDSVVVVASPNHPIFSIKKPTLADLTSFNWLLPSQSVGPRVWLDRLFAEHGFPKPKIKIEVPCVRLMASIVAEAKLLSFVSDRRLHKKSYEHHLLRMVPVEDAVMPRKFSVVWLKNRPLPPLAQGLVRVLNEKGREFYSEKR